jgi:hypothetical protein
MTSPPKVFISYSHLDRPLVEELHSHLIGLEKDKQIELWRDTLKVVPGEEWRKKIIKALNEASIILQVITVNFLASDFINETEVPIALERRSRGEAHIIPVIARDCSWNLVSWLSKLQVQTHEGKPIWSLVDDELRTRALINVTTTVAVKAKEVRAPYPPGPPDRPAPALEPTLSSLGPQKISPAVWPSQPPPAQSRAASAGGVRSRALSQQKMRLYLLTLLVALAGFWFIVASFVLPGADPKWLAVGGGAITQVTSKKYLSRGENSAVSFLVKSGDAAEHDALLDLDDGRSIFVIPDRAIYKGALPSGKGIPKVVPIYFPIHDTYFGSGEEAGLGLTGRLDGTDFRRVSLPLYIAPFPHITRLELYVRNIALTMTMIYFFWLCYWSFKKES